MNFTKMLAGALIFALPTVMFGYYDESVEYANALAERWVIKDFSTTPEKYNLDSGIQRKEMMKIAVKLLNVEPKECGQDKIFTDVDTAGWECKYIKTALSKGIISGWEKFRPNDLLTKTEAMKIILKSLNLRKTVETDVWQADYMNSAFEYGLIETKYSDYNSNATRDWVFKIAETALVRGEEEEKMEDMKEVLGLFSEEAK